MLGVLLAYLFAQMLLLEEPEEEQPVQSAAPCEPKDLYRVRRAG